MHQQPCINVLLNKTTLKTGRAFEAFGYAVLEQKQDLKKVIQSQKSSSPN